MNHKIEYYIIQGNNQNIQVQIIRSKRKSIGLQVKKSGEAVARIPEALSDAELKEFLEKHRSWIIEKVTMMQEREKSADTTGATPIHQLTQTEMQAIKEKIAERVYYYGEIMGVTWGRITIRNQKTRWGSCSSKGNLNFNYQLYYLPDELLDYVVVHELAHRRHMNHSAEFWKEVERYFPAYKECRKRLKEIRMVES
jgi:hypothetical protein